MSNMPDGSKSSLDQHVQTSVHVLGLPTGIQLEV